MLIFFETSLWSVIRNEIVDIALADLIAQLFEDGLSLQATTERERKEKRCQPSTNASWSENTYDFGLTKAMIFSSNASFSVKFVNGSCTVEELLSLGGSIVSTNNQRKYVPCLFNMPSPATKIECLNSRGIRRSLNRKQTISNKASREKERECDASTG